MAAAARNLNGTLIIYFASDGLSALLLSSHASLLILSPVVATRLVLVTWPASAQNDELQYLN